MRCSSVGECGRRTTNMYSEDNFDLPPRVPHVPNATTAYLLGLGPMPPPNSQSLSVATFYSQLEKPSVLSNEE